MERYKNLGGDSSVFGYEFGSDSITVTFNDQACYEYTNLSAGVANINQMKALATRGQGLQGFINTQVKKKYARKLR
jgi:hypothetical protein